MKTVPASTELMKQMNALAAVPVELSYRMNFGTG